MEKPVIIFGAGGLGKAALEIFENNKVPVYCFLDDDKSLHNTEIGNVSVLGSTEDNEYLKIVGKKCEAFVAEDDNKVRKSTVKLLNEDRSVMPVNAIHSNAVFASTALLGHGNFINGEVKMGAFSEIGNHCILHTDAIIEHEAKLGNFVQVGAGAVVNAGVRVEDEVFIGSGVVIVAGVSIGKGARIGAGSVVVADVQARQTLFGNPAKAID